MPRYQLTDPQGKTATIEADRPPTDVEMKEIFSQLPKYKAEPEKTTLQKVVPYARPLLEAGGMAAAGILGTGAGPVGTVVGAGLGYAAGHQAANALEEYAGVKRPSTLGEAAKETVMQDIPSGMSMEMGGQIAGKFVGTVIDKITGHISPMKILSNMYQKASKTPFAKEGKTITEETGIDLTPAQETGSKMLNLAENTARKAGITSDQVHANDVVQANQAIKRINTLMDKISPSGVSKESLGTEIQWTTQNAINAVKKVRDAAADVDYGAVRMLAGEKPVIPTTAMKKELEAIVDEYDIPGGERIASQAKQMLAKFDEMVTTTSKGGKSFDKMTVDKAMKMRSVYSKASAGTGDIFTDIDKAQSRMLAARMLGAIEKDFDAAPTVIKGVDEKVGDALKLANMHYKAYSQHIDAVQNSVLGKLLGKNTFDPLTGQTINSIAPEKIADSLLNLHPSGLRVAKQILQGDSPITWNAIKRYSVEQALKKGMNIAPSTGMNPVPLSTSKFITALPEKENLEIMFGKKEMQEIESLQKALVRMGDRSAANTSNTALVSDFLSWLTPKGMVKGAAKAMGLKTIANAMTTPGGRQALRDIAKKETNPAALNAAVKALTINYGAAVKALIINYGDTQPKEEVPDTAQHDRQKGETLKSWALRLHGSLTKDKNAEPEK